jgi:hypothetical protein
MSNNIYIQKGLGQHNMYYNNIFLTERAISHFPASLSEEQLPIRQPPLWIDHVV